MDSGDRRRKGWKGAVLLLCVTGLMKGYSFSARYFTGFTPNQTVNPILFSLLASFLILIFISDALNYKPVVVLGSLCSITEWIIFIWFRDNVTAAQVRGWLHGVNLATTELAYYPIVYAYVDSQPGYYRRATGYTTFALYFGESIANFLLHFQILTNPLQTHHYIFLGTSAAGCVLALLLPKVFDPLPPDPVMGGLRPPPPRQNQVMYSTPTSVDPRDTLANLQAPSDAWYFKFRNQRDGPGQKTFIQKMKDSPSQTRINFVSAYTNKVVVKWSFWYVLSFAMFLQMETSHLEQTYGEVRPRAALMEGIGAGIPAILALTLASSSFNCGGYAGFCAKMRRVAGGNRSLGYYLLAGVGWLVQAVAIFVGNSYSGGGRSGTGNADVVYGCYIVFRTVFIVLAIIAKSNIAEKIRERSVAFIFGINSLVGVLLWAGFHLIFKVWLDWAPSAQNGFLAWSLLTLGLVLVLMGIVPPVVKFVTSRRNAHHATIS